VNDLIFIGAGGHARACIDVVELEGQFRVAGLVEKSGSRDLVDAGYPIIGCDEDLKVLKKKYNYALVTVGQVKTHEPRERLFDKLSELGFELPVIISPRAYVSSSTKIGAGTIVMHGAVVNAEARIGRNCIINNQALVEHDVYVKDHCHVATGAVLNGGVKVDAGVFIGSGAVIKQGVQIGEHSIIGMGSIVRNDIQAGQIIKE